MKLAVALIASLCLAAPALACPNMDHDDATAPKTADKDKKPAEKKPEAPKTDKDKPADTAKSKDTKDTTKKTGDKVSLK